jgi:hypothetical protein
MTLINNIPLKKLNHLNSFIMVLVVLVWWFGPFPWNFILGIPLILLYIFTYNTYKKRIKEDRIK